MTRRWGMGLVIGMAGLLAACAGVDSTRDNWRPLPAELARLSLPGDDAASREAWATSTHYAERLSQTSGGTQALVEMHILTFDRIFTERPGEATFTARMAEFPKLSGAGFRHGPVAEVTTSEGTGHMRVSTGDGESCVSGQLWLRLNVGDNLARYNARLSAWQCRDAGAGAYSSDEAVAFLNSIGVTRNTYDGRGIPR